MTGWRRYRKKPVVVRAKQLEERREIDTREGAIVGEPGDYLIEGIEGELYPCGEEIFEQTYEPAEVDYDRPQRLRVERDPDRARQAASEETVTAVGVQLPSGTIVIEWRRKAFEPEERAKKPVLSEYRCIEDAEQATAGTVVWEDEQ